MIVTGFKIGDAVAFLEDPKNVPYKVLWVSGNGQYGTIRRTDKNPPANVEVPFRVLKKLPKPKTVYGPGSLILDGEGDYWLSGPNNLWEYITYDGKVDRMKIGDGIELSFDQSIETIEENHGPVKDIYVAPVR